MADHQRRVHPVFQDPEATTPQPSQRATAPPLFPLEVSKSGLADQESQNHPPLQRTIPYSYSKPPNRNCCKRCCCWTLCLVFLLIVVLGILAAIIYFVFHPKIPDYSVDSLRITQLSLHNDNSLDATFNVNITATNPNKKVGIYYESGSSLHVLFSGTELCQGSLPVFYQGHRNTTVMELTLTGQTQDARGLLQSLQAQQQTGSVPLNLRARVPVRIKLGSLKLMKWKFLVRCTVTVDSVTENNTIRIKDSSCRFRFGF